MDIYEVIMTIQYIAIAVLFAELIYALLQKPSEMQKYVIILTISTILMLVGYIVEIKAVNMTEALAGVTMSYLGKPFIMISSFLFICSYYEINVKKYAVIIMTIWSSVFPIIVATNERHHLYYSTVGFTKDAIYSSLVLGHGIMYYMYAVTTVVYFIGCVYVIIRGYKKAKRNNELNKKLATYSILMTASGISGYLIYLANLTRGYDSTVLGVIAGAFFLSLIFFQCKVFDPLAMAKDYALDDSSTGLVVYDEKGNVVYKNAITEKMLKYISKSVLKGMQEDSMEYSSKDKRFEIKKKLLVSDGVTLGTSYEINDITAVYNYQAVLERDIRERTAKIENIQRSIIASVASIVEARSMETGEHAKRTSDMCEKIAHKLKEMGFYKNTLTDNYIELLVDAAPLHDIGKIAVPDAILLKPGKLTNEEFEQMKYHTTAGSDIIENAMRGLESDEYIQIAEDIACYHHEKWDGSGYPKGLYGEEIPLSARIMAVADCYDALTNERCYKPAYTSKEAVKILKSESWNHFDPNVFEAFLRVVGEK